MTWGGFAKMQIQIQSIWDGAWMDCIPKELPSGDSTIAVLRPCSKSQGLVDTLVVVTGFPVQARDNLVRMRPSAGCG